MPDSKEDQRSAGGGAPKPERLGLIAGNGRFPFLLLDAARAHGLTVVVAAIKEETDPEIDARAAADPDIRVHWLSLGELSKLIDTFHAERVTRAVMAGQVRHTQIFSSIRPDWRLAKLLLNLRARNTDMLLGAVAKVLADEGIELISSTHYLEPLLAKPGVLTRRAPTEAEQKDIAYGRTVARAIAEYDLGQTVVIAAQACVAVEAMEGTDATIERAGALMRRLDLDAAPDPSDFASTLSRALTIVKVAKPKQDMRFDVPVIGVATVEAMARAGATCLAIESGRTLLFDSAAIIAAADEAGIAIVAQPHQIAASEAASAAGRAETGA
jgi:UDP-2,3-diacylglucosamine hydrolase